jgi:hypothetical protein
MLAGVQITPAALKNAEEMLESSSRSAGVDRRVAPRLLTCLAAGR